MRDAEARRGETWRRRTIARLDRALYPNTGGHWDDERLRALVLEELRPEHHLLDLGAGAGIVTEMHFRGLCARVCGVDPDDRVRSNPHLDEGLVGIGERIPYPDASFDVVVADNVLEHLERPREVFVEVARVLRPGGRFLAKTPNRRHYMPLIARLTPLAFHRFVNRRRGRAGEDTFPTRYRANTPGDLRRTAARAGLVLRETRLVEGRPEYLRFHPAAYVAGWLYERAVNLAPLLAPFRCSLLAVLEKPAAQPALARDPREAAPRGTHSAAALPARAASVARPPT